MWATLRHIPGLRISDAKQKRALRGVESTPVTRSPFLLDLCLFRQWMESILIQIDPDIRWDQLLEIGWGGHEGLYHPFIDTLLLKALKNFFRRRMLNRAEPLDSHSGFSVLAGLNRIKVEPMDVKTYLESCETDSAAKVHQTRQTLKKMAPWAVSSAYKDYTFAAGSENFYETFMDCLREHLDEVDRTRGDEIARGERRFEAEKVDEFDLMRLYDEARTFETQVRKIRQVHAADVPQTYQEVVNSEEKDHWVDAMAAEKSKMAKYDVFDPVPKDSVSGKKLKSQWEFSRKGKDFVAQVKIVGSSAYKYAPTCSYSSVRFLLALTDPLHLEVARIHLKDALMHVPIADEVYVNPPPSAEQRKNVVWKLNKVMYGMRSASAMLYESISAILFSHELRKSKVDPCLFLKRGLYVLLCADEMLVCARDPGIVSFWFNNSQFEADLYGVRSLESSEQFMGMTLDGEKVSMKDSIERLQRRYMIPEVETTSPVDLRSESKSPPLEEEQITQYRSLLGSLQHIANVVRLDILAPVRELSNHFSEPKQIHLDKLFRVAEYLVNTKELGLGAIPIRTPMTAVSDETDPNSNGLQLRVLTSVSADDTRVAYIILLNGTVVNFAILKSEPNIEFPRAPWHFVVMKALTAAKSLRNILNESGYPQKPIELCETTSDYAWDMTFGYSHYVSIPKSVDIWYKSVHEMVNNGGVELNTIKVDYNIAEALTRTRSGSYIYWVKKMVGQNSWI